jgi:glycerophosphoryl diester phosphodiesterase
MTQLFYSYKQGEKFEAMEITERKKTRHKVGTLATMAAVIIAVVLITVFFDRLFPVNSNVDVIAHRGGGNEGPENTVAGLEIARKAGAYGSEIDIQRTKDGHYIINHDGTFKRVAGVSRKPEEMMLKEVKKMSIDGEPVATIEEMLTASKGSMVLFIELKGNTADRKMADDAVRLVKGYQMEEECVLISLKYDIIDYIETTYPEIQTGFLTFASFGETAALNCDYLGLEEESATADTVNAIHNENKKVLVWTVNEAGSQKYFLCSRVDGIITDNVSQALKLFGELEDRSDLERMIDKIKTLL